MASNEFPNGFSGLIIGFIKTKELTYVVAGGIAGLLLTLGRNSRSARWAGRLLGVLCLAIGITSGYGVHCGACGYIDLSYQFGNKVL